MIQINRTLVYNFEEKKDMTVVDVRTRSEYAGGHVANSVNIPLNEVQERIDEIKNLKLEKARMNDIELSIDMSEFSDNSHVKNEIKFNDEKVS